MILNMRLFYGVSENTMYELNTGQFDMVSICAIVYKQSAIARNAISWIDKADIHGTVEKSFG